MSDCVDVELELSNRTIELIKQHSERSGLPFNDALVELLEMAMQEEAHKLLQE